MNPSDRIRANLLRPRSYRNPQQRAGPVEAGTTRFSNYRFPGSYIGGYNNEGEGADIPKEKFRSNLRYYGNTLLPNNPPNIPWYLSPALGYRELLQNYNNSLGGYYQVLTHGYDIPFNSDWDQNR